MCHLPSKRADPAVSRWPAARRRGFTLVELVIVLALLATLAALAFPNFIAQIRQSRRSEALIVIAQVQQAQEQWRAQHTSYTDDLGPGMGLGLSATSHELWTASGRYRLTLADANASGYRILVRAHGSQAADEECGYLEVSLQAGFASYASGPAPSVDNPPPQNNKCWKQ